LPDRNIGDTLPLRASEAWKFFHELLLLKRLAAAAQVLILARSTPAINHTAEFLKYAGKTMNLIKYDEPVGMLRKV
jgi:hypothetical protein